ncbi:MAG TPA: OmpA family protein [Anaeromyxobacteraceae bacterium]|nr:OmpA family protein [Anaeromyxobacteraceae bacterium]
MDLTREVAVLVVGVLVAGTGCVVPESKYKAQQEEAEKYKKSYSDESQRANAAASAEAERQSLLAGQLAKSKERLEAERAAAAADAEHQRQLASHLEQEKSALQEKSTEYEALRASLEKEIKAGQIQISELQGKMTVRLAERILFPSGSATINERGKETLKKIADAFKTVKGRVIRVEGHTDNVPIHTVQFPSNWELSAARAIAVVRFLQNRNVDPNLLGAAGYAEYQPIAPNDSSEGRAENRRIEITLAAPPTRAPPVTASETPGNGNSRPTQQ